MTQSMLPAVFLAALTFVACAEAPDEPANGGEPLGAVDPFAVPLPTAPESTCLAVSDGVCDAETPEQCEMTLREWASSGDAFVRARITGLSFVTTGGVDKDWAATGEVRDVASDANCIPVLDLTLEAVELLQGEAPTKLIVRLPATWLETAEPRLAQSDTGEWRWPDEREDRRPLRVGQVVVLPVQYHPEVGLWSPTSPYVATVYESSRGPALSGCEKSDSAPRVSGTLLDSLPTLLVSGEAPRTTFAGGFRRSLASVPDGIRAMLSPQCFVSSGWVCDSAECAENHGIDVGN